MTMCPYCGQPAPLVYRGVLAYCAGCGGMRGPLTARSVNYAGQVSKTSGLVAKIFAWLVLGGGSLLALLCYGLFATLFPGAPAAWVSAALVMIVTSVVFGFSFWGGRALHDSGARTEQQTKEAAVLALAASRQGELRDHDVVQALGLGPREAAALLDAMVKRLPEQMSLEIDADGGLYYAFPRLDPRFRVAESNDPGWTVTQRAAAQPWPAHGGGRVAVPDVTSRPRVEAGPLDAELEQQALLEAEEAAQGKLRR